MIVRRKVSVELQHPCRSRVAASKLPYLRSMVKGIGAVALDIVVPSVAEGIIRCHKHLMIREPAILLDSSV